MAEKWKLEKENSKKQIFFIFFSSKIFWTLFLQNFEGGKNEYLYKIDSCTFRAQTYNGILFLYVIFKIKKRAKCNIVLKISF